MKNPAFPMPQSKPFDVDLDALLHPAQAFEHPRDVIGDADLTLNEKRAILASWASDACAVEAAPALRCAPGVDRPVPIDEILEALRALDKQANELAIDAAASRRLARRQAIERFRSRRTTDQGDTGCDPSH
jgi:hypothetical protein